jgi:hypothetical protein
VNSQIETIAAAIRSSLCTPSPVNHSSIIFELYDPWRQVGARRWWCMRILWLKLEMAESITLLRQADWIVPSRLGPRMHWRALSQG